MSDATPNATGVIATGTVAIRAETSVVDHDSCTFIVDRVVHPGGPFAFRRTDPTVDAPLVARLFALGDIVHVLIADTTVTVTKSPAGSWDTLRRAIGATIRHQLTSGEPAIVESTSVRSDRQVRGAIEDLLTRTVNPSIASHGGMITVVDLVDGVLSIAMSGGCQGCASSTATLRDGFESMARLVAPEITTIVDTTDHASGTTPFHPAGSASGPSPIAMTRPSNRPHTH